LIRKNDYAIFSQVAWDYAVTALRFGLSQQQQQQQQQQWYQQYTQ